MYQIRPLSVVPENIDLPSCMYNIKPLNGIKFSSLNGELGPTITIKRVKMEPELQAIEERQLEVIAKLKKLKTTVDEMIKNAEGVKGGLGSKTPIIRSTASTTANNNNASASSSNASSALFNVVIPSELVIEANPNRPPLSLIFFRHLHPSVKTMSHMHSTCKEQVNQKLTSLFSRDVESPCSTVRVVWKNNSGSRLTPPNLGSCGVEGESNVARYLSRVFSKPDSALNYDGLALEDLVLVDSVLDSSDLVDTAPDGFLQCLEAYIQKRDNNTRTIADYVGYSTLQYLAKNLPKKSQPLPKSLNQWMNCLTNEIPSLC